jgi:hypothetical protein
MVHVFVLLAFCDGGVIYLYDGFGLVYISSRHFCKFGMTDLKDLTEC